MPDWMSGEVYAVRILALEQRHVDEDYRNYFEVLDSDGYRRIDAPAVLNPTTSLDRNDLEATSALIAQRINRGGPNAPTYECDLSATISMFRYGDATLDGIGIWVVISVEQELEKEEAS